MKILQNKKTIKVIAIICLISILFTSCATKSIQRENIEYVKSKYSGDNYHSVDSTLYKVIAKSGLIELLFDETTATIAIFDTNSNALWTTLPDTPITKAIQSYVLEINLSDGGNKVYTLNTQDNSVAHGNFSYKTSSDGVSVTYSMALDKETGAKSPEQIKEDDIRADLTVNYTLRDGSLYVNVNMNTLFLPEEVVLEDITVLNNFGAYEISGSEDYIFVPDGSGAIIKTGIENKDFVPISLAVYGEDMSATESRSSSECLIGAFGVKRARSAFLCIIEKGDSIARINAYRNNDKSYNSVNSSFKITDVGNKNKIGHQYKNEIQLCYRFLSGKSASYSGMATACRETLIRNSVLSTKTVEINSEHIPMVVSLQGGYVNGKGKYHTLSSYSQAISLMTLLKAKGVNNVYLRYNGLYDEANNGNSSDFDDFNKSLGTKKEFDELYTYLNSQKFSLFIDTDILTSCSNSSSAKAINGSSIKDNTTYSFPLTTSAQEFLKLGKLENKVNDILTASEKIKFDGYSLNDAGKYLYSDYSYDYYSRATAREELYSQIPVLATSKLLMIDTGNFYSLKNADVISNIPVSPLAYSETASYEGIPFIQMLVHGILEYSATGFNTSDNSAVFCLKAIEYGCLPSADWYCTAYDKTLDEKYYFDKNINEMVTYYTKANEALSILRDARMTSHNKIQEGVYCSEYDNSIKVYVNYTESAVIVHGVVVGAMDCITIV